MKFPEFLTFLVIFMISTTPVFGDEPPSNKITTELIEALSRVELSYAEEDEIGDKKLKNKAYGPLQIRKPCLDDVNKMCGTNYKPEDCLGNRELSAWVFHRYMEKWATKKRIGREPTDEDRVRIWNGGPNGWKRESSLEHWEKVKRELDIQKELTKQKELAKK